jgi:hypothetical protein
MQKFTFEDKESFVKKVEELVKSGVPKQKIHTNTPYYVHEAAHLLDEGQSGVRFFQGTGALTGFMTGWLFTIFTVFHWPSPMITGGKPLISIPPFLIIAYELTILFGCLGGFLGFLHLTRSPAVAKMFSFKDEFSIKFEIEVGETDRK